MRHGQHHVAPGFILEARQLRTDLEPALRFLPYLRRLYNRHADLLPIDAVNLLAHDVLDLCQCAFRQGQVAEDPRCKLADESCPHEQLMTGNLSIGGFVAQRLAEKFAHPH